MSDEPSRDAIRRIWEHGWSAGFRADGYDAPTIELTDDEFDAFLATATGRDDEERLVIEGAKAYAADTYKGARDMAGDPADVWGLLHESDQMACIHKARVVLRGAGVAS